MVTNIKITFDKDGNTHEFQFGTHVKINDSEYLDLKQPELKVIQIKEQINKLLTELLNEQVQGL